MINVWGSTLFHLEDAAASMGPGGIRTMPDVFTPFKDKVRDIIGCAGCWKASLAMKECQLEPARWQSPQMC